MFRIKGLQLIVAKNTVQPETCARGKIFKICFFQKRYVFFKMIGLIFVRKIDAFSDGSVDDLLVDLELYVSALFYIIAPEMIIHFFRIKKVDHKNAIGL